MAWGGWQLPAEPRSSCPLQPATAMKMLQRPCAPSCPAYEPLVLLQSSQGLLARLCAAGGHGTGGKGTLSLGLAPELEGFPGAGTCLVERGLSTVPPALSFGVFLLPEQTLCLFLLHSFQGWLWGGRTPRWLGLLWALLIAVLCR